MAYIRYAVQNGAWSSGSTWDNGIVPLDDDDIYADGRTITINQNINVLRLTNFPSPSRLPGNAIPIMTSNTTPSGVAFSTSGSTSTNFPWNAFDQSTSTIWQSQVANSGSIGYQFTSGKIIKQYAFLSYAASNIFSPRNWTFQGSNDGVSYTTIETVTAFTTAVNTWYVRDISSNTTSYTYYRMNITAVQTVGNQPVVPQLNMTELTSSAYSTGNSGSFISGGDIQISASAQVANGFYGIHPIGSNTISFLTITGSHRVGITGSVAAIQGGFFTNRRGILISNGGTLGVIGDLINSATAGGTGNNIAIFCSTGSVTITGSILAIGGGNTGASPLYIENGTASFSGSINSITFATPIAIGAGNAQVNIITTPIINGTSTGNMQLGLTGANTGVINYTGPVIGNNSAGIGIAVGTMTINITGSVYSIGAAAGIASTVASTINVNGPITANNSAPGLSSTSTTATVRVTGPLIASQNNINPIFSPKIQLISTSTPTYTLETDTFPREVTFYDAAFTSSLPTQTNVRSGSTYGGSAEFSGSMSVPSPSNVRYGVPVDNITGSATLTPQDIFDYAVSALTGSNTIGSRLKNISTTQTTAATIAAFKGK